MRSSVLSSWYLLASMSSWIEPRLFRGKASLRAILYGDRQHNILLQYEQLTSASMAGSVLGYKSMPIFHGPNLQKLIAFKRMHISRSTGIFR